MKSTNPSDPPQRYAVEQALISTLARFNAFVTTSEAGIVNDCAIAFTYSDIPKSIIFHFSISLFHSIETHLPIGISTRNNLLFACPCNVAHFGLFTNIRH